MATGSASGDKPHKAPSKPKPKPTKVKKPWRLSLAARLPPWALKTRVLATPVIAAFLTFLFTVITPINRLCGLWVFHGADMPSSCALHYGRGVGAIGTYAFHINSSLALFFFPKGRVSQIVELNTASLVGALAGHAWAQATLAIAAYCGRTYGADTATPRAILGVGLATLSLFFGFLRSRVPRLNVASRAAMFFPIFLLTTNQGILHYQTYMFTDQFFTFLFAYGIATVCGIIFAEHSSFPALASHFMKAVDTTCQLLPTSLDTILHSEVEVGGDDSPPSSPRTARDEEADVRGVPGLCDPSARVKQQELAKQLRAEIRDIQQTHKDYSLDIVHARHHPKALTPVIRLLSRLQRNPLLGPTGHVPGDRIRAALERTYASPLFHRGATHSPMSSRARTPRRSLSRHSLASAMEGVAIVPSPSQLSLELNRLAEIRGPRSIYESIRGSIRSEGARPDSPAREDARSRLKQTCSSLAHTIAAALQGTGNLVAVACDWQGDQAPKDVVHIPELQAQLDRALKDLQKRLGGIVDTIYGVDGLARTTSDSHLSARAITFEDELIETDWLDDEDRFRIAFYMIALLDLAKDTKELLSKAQELEATSGQKRWYFPPIPWPWSPVAPHAAMPSIEGVSAPPQDDAQDAPREEDLDYVHKLLHEKRALHPHTAGSLAQRAANAWRLLWDRRGVVMARVWLSKLFYGMKHSRHVHFAVKQTVGICLLFVPGLMPPGQAGRVWYDRSRGPWMVVSFMYVIEVTTGATLRIGFYRMCGTFLGCVTGYVCVLIAHRNPYGLVALGTFFAVPISYGVCFTHFAPMMIVYAITLAPLLFLEYLHLDEGQGIFELSWMRFVDIVIGIAAAVLLGSWLWPIHARVQYFSAVGDTMDNITDYYLRMSRDLLRPSPVYNANSKQYRVLERRARVNIARCRTLQSVQQREISLLPRPTRLYAEIVDLLERLLETFSEIRTLRFSLPRKATVLDVLPIRRELVSAILVNLWACGQAFRSRAPLPQVFPSPRNPLSEVMETTDDYAREVRQMRAREKHRRMRDSTDERESDSGAGQAYHAELGVLYAMAENEALTEAINCIDEILAAARTLFGTQSFLDMNVDPQASKDEAHSAHSSAEWWHRE